jgi:hypothetical protein
VCAGFFPYRSTPIVYINKKQLLTHTNSAPTSIESEGSFMDERRNRMDDARYDEEIAAEVLPLNRDLTLPENERPRAVREDETHIHERNKDYSGAGKGAGIAAVILAALSLFILPVFFGGAAVVLGFVARRLGARSLGNWAIGLGAVSIIISLLFAPFF